MATSMPISIPRGISFNVVSREVKNRSSVYYVKILSSIDNQFRDLDAGHRLSK